MALSQPDTTQPHAPLPANRFPTAAEQAERLRRIFHHLRLGESRFHGPLERVETNIPRPTGSDAFLAFPLPSALGGSFSDAVLRLWHACEAAHRIMPTQNQSADPPDPRHFPESCKGFHENGHGVAYGDFCVVPIQLGRLHRASSPMQAYGSLGMNGQHPLFAYECLALLLGVAEVADRIRSGTASMRFVERIRSSLNPADHLLRRKERNRVPDFAILAGNGERILLGGEPSPNKAPDAGAGIGLATRFPVATLRTHTQR